LISTASHTHPGDLDLAAAIVARDRKATARLVEIYADPVHHYIWKRLAPKVDMVDDLVQETFIAAWRGIGSYSGQASLRTWLLSIARNKVEDHYRGTLKRPLVELEDAEPELIDEGGSVEWELDARREARRAAGILLKLPYEYAAALRWRYWDGDSAREMAAATGRSEKAVERLLARARARFKVLWMEGENGVEKRD
jgi:RNA polymerase sigma-70 factor (ECF subfamily)